MAKEKKVREQKTGKELMAQFQVLMEKVRKFYVGIAVGHIVSTSLLLMLAFTGGLGKLKGELSQTVIFCSVLGILSTGLASWRLFVAWGDTLKDKHEEMPRYDWFNSSYMYQVVCGFTLSLAVVPGTVVFMFHSMGKSMQTYIMEDIDDDAESAVFFHLACFLMCAAFDLYVLLRITRQILAFSKAENEEEGGGGDDEEGDDSQGEERYFKVTKQDKILGVFMIAGNLIYMIDLVTVAAIKANSGTALACVVQTIMLLAVCYRMFGVLKKKRLPESWLMDTRAYLILHGFFIFVVFWVALSIFLFIHLPTDTDKDGLGFFDVLALIPSSRRLLVVLVILVFGSTNIGYAFSLLTHAKCMPLSDQMEAQFLIEDMMADM
jgi:hypothetical protein